MISHVEKIIVPEIPKCGSSSAYAWLKEKDRTIFRRDHAPLIDYRNWCNVEDDYHVMLIGRNPYTRAVSAYEYAQYSENNSNLRGKSVLTSGFQEWYQHIEYEDLPKSNTTQSLVLNQEEDEYLDASFRPQYSFINYFEDTRSHANERCDDLLKNSEFLKLEECDFLPKVNTHKRTLEKRSYDIKNWNLYYTDMDIVTQIQMLYAEDFNLWGYDYKINPYTEEPWL
jgi:hypothetical protein